MIGYKEQVSWEESLKIILDYYSRSDVKWRISKEKQKILKTKTKYDSVYDKLIVRTSGRLKNWETTLDDYLQYILYEVDNIDLYTLMLSIVNSRWIDMFKSFYKNTRWSFSERLHTTINFLRKYNNKKDFMFIQSDIVQQMVTKEYHKASYKL